MFLVLSSRYVSFIIYVSYLLNAHELYLLTVNGIVLGIFYIWSLVETTTDEIYAEISLLPDISVSGKIIIYSFNKLISGLLNISLINIKNSFFFRKLKSQLLNLKTTYKTLTILLRC